MGIVSSDISNESWFLYVVNKLDACSKNKTWILKRKYEGKHYPHNCHVKLSIPYSKNMYSIQTYIHRLDTKPFKKEI